MSKNEFKDVVFGYIKENESLFDADNDEMVLAAWKSFDLPTILLLKCFKLEATSEKEDQSLLLAAGVLSDLLSCILTLRQGFIRPAAVVLRAAIENLCTLVAIHKNEQTYQKYLKDTLNPTADSVPKAKPEFTPLVQTWGQLSEKFVHETIESLGRVLAEEKGIRVVPKRSDITNSKIRFDFVNLMLFSMVSKEFVAVLEWIFVHKLGDLREWERVEGGLKRRPDTEFVEYLSRCEKRIKGSS